LCADLDAAAADEEAEPLEDQSVAAEPAGVPAACARADEISKLRKADKHTQNSRPQALGKSYLMHASFGRKPAALISADTP
jgi:hypothetical protein